MEADVLAAGPVARGLAVYDAARLVQAAVGAAVAAGALGGAVAAITAAAVTAAAAAMAGARHEHAVDSTAKGFLPLRGSVSGLSSVGEDFDEAKGGTQSTASVEYFEICSGVRLGSDSEAAEEAE